jgi:hypothetical protein
VAELRSLVVVLGDQLDLDAAAFDGFDAAVDAVWMAEVAGESTHVWSSKPRTVMFLASMRHFALELQAAGRMLHYTRLDATGNCGSLAAQLQADILRLQPTGLVMTAPGDWRVLQDLKAVAEGAGLRLEIREDRHFFSSVREFSAHAKGRRSLRMEYFYREQRKRHRVLMQGDPGDGEPVGGQWNFDADNRESFGAGGPGAVPPRAAFEPVPPRRWDDAALADFAARSSTVACECPRHVSELLAQLAHFETYSAQCGRRNAADGDLHDYLRQVAAASRARFEAALEHVALHEGMLLPGAAQ